MPNATKDLAGLLGAGARASEAAAVDESVASDTSPSSPGIWPWVVVGAGGAVLGAGAYFYSDGSTKLDESKSLPKTAENQQKAFDLHDEGNESWDLGVTLMSVGAAVAVGGIAWWALAPEGEGSQAKVERAEPGLWLSATPNGTFFLGGRF